MAAWRWSSTVPPRRCGSRSRCRRSSSPGGVTIAEVAVEGLAAHGPGADLAVALAERAENGQVWTSAAVGLLLPASGIQLAATDDPATYVVESV